MTSEQHRKTPSKPKPSSASTARLVAHYNSQCGPYNDAILAKFGDQPDVRDGFMAPFAPDYPDGLVIREALIERIKRQNHRLGRTLKPRARQLLCHKVEGPDGKPIRNADGRTVGYSYNEVLALLAEEFPECSTSVAALRWYVTHMRSDADDEGLEWPDMPQLRPRSKRPEGPPAEARQDGEEAPRGADPGAEAAGPRPMAA